MAPKKPPTYHFTGLAQVVPSNYQVSSSSSSRGRYVSESSELESSTKSIHKDDFGRNSSKFSRSYKSEEFVDKSSGRLGYKEEAKYDCTYKCDDKEQGYTHEYQTQVKYKHVAYPMKNASSSNNNSSNKRVDYY